MAKVDYSSRHLQVLDGLEAVRKRPGMYIGSTDSRGLMHCVWEIIDNAVDEALAGFCDHIVVTLHADGSVEIHDNGRGIPVDVEPSTGLTGVEVVFTKLHAGGKFGGGSYAASGGLHGVGASVVNALTSRLDVSVERGGAFHDMSFRRGEPGVFADSGAPSPDAVFTPFEESSVLRKHGRVKRGQTGTRVRYWADPTIFLADAQIDDASLAQRARQTAFLVPGLCLEVRDARDPDTDPVVETFQAQGGISEFVEFLAPDEAVTPIWRLQGSGTFTESVPVLDENNRMVTSDVERECAVDIALRWGIGYDTTLQSYVNIIATPKGGTHVAGFEAAVLRVVRKQITANARALKVGKDKVERDDALAGLTAVVTVSVPEPQFEGQTKEVLGTAAVRTVVSQVVSAQLTKLFTSKKRDEKKQARNVLEKITAEMKARISARQHRANQRRKNALESSSMPGKLKDCRAAETVGSELFIVEGDSALGTGMAARDSEFQALLPIRGKILNVQKASLTDMLNNAECAAIIQVVGGGSGRSFSLEDVRYEKIIIMTDADVDGAHIRTLLLTLFFRYMRPLVEAGRVYAAVPPLHRIDVARKGRAPARVIYTYAEEEMRRTISKWERKGRKVKPPQRYKGLGEMDADQLAETTMDPGKRTLRRITVGDAQNAQRVFELLMGSEVAPRKAFIVAAADELDKERIDA